ncbi:MAG TPA: DUF4160 domain-containing protein [Candidatus Spyradenecus faecavium]|uniref:DUF4160 domain-containing protein n=1 Tax=Candidatus Spyradenecus faecavium TaxID=2840947 RepID=A0A9D1T396_9BACT|nr:DUF4160 domain-containing protein [Candidatus Spyradenecus faecavium]
MPELARFLGLIVRMQYHDVGRHNKPHVHVVYGEFTASVGIDGELLEGTLPARQLRLLQGWLALHEEALYGAWNRAVRGEDPGRIAPLG